MCNGGRGEERVNIKKKKTHSRGKKFNELSSPLPRFVLFFFVVSLPAPLLARLSSACKISKVEILFFIVDIRRCQRLKCWIICYEVLLFQTADSWKIPSKSATLAQLDAVASAYAVWLMLSTKFWLLTKTRKKKTQRILVFTVNEKLHEKSHRLSSDWFFLCSETKSALNTQQMDVDRQEFFRRICVVEFGAVVSLKADNLSRFVECFVFEYYSCRHKIQQTYLPCTKSIWLTHSV